MTARRLVTAREQVQMLSPWRVANGRYLTEQPATKAMFDRIREQIGIKLGTGIASGCGNYCGRLEDGSWIYVTDSDEPMWGSHALDLSLREEYEAKNGPLGWYVGIHPNRHDPKDGTDYAAVEPYHQHVDEKATTADLPDVIRHAISTIPRNLSSGERAPDAAPDYEKLINPRLEIDDDYGDIFGKEGRRTASGSMFDWLPYEHPGGGVEEAYQANLENGHSLTAWKHRDPARGWTWTLMVPSGSGPVWNGTEMVDTPLTRLENGGGSSWASHAPSPGRPVSTERIPTFEEARRRAEEWWADTYWRNRRRGMRTAAAGWANWTRVGPNDDEALSWITDRYLIPGDEQADAHYQKVQDEYYQHFMAPLENGHQLHVFSDRHPWSDPESVGWSWMIAPHAKVNQGDLDDYLAGDGLDTPALKPPDYRIDHLRHIPTKEQAMVEAEEAYQKMFPIGSDTGGHRSPIMDSGVDYDAMFAPKPLDDDFGDIFGGGS